MSTPSRSEGRRSKSQIGHLIEFLSFSLMVVGSRRIPGTAGPIMFNGIAGSKRAQKRTWGGRLAVRQLVVKLACLRVLGIVAESLTQVVHGAGALAAGQVHQCQVKRDDRG